MARRVNRLKSGIRRKSLAGSGTRKEFTGENGQIVGRFEHGERKRRTTFHHTIHTRRGGAGAIACAPPPPIHPAPPRHTSRPRFHMYDHADRDTVTPTHRLHTYAGTVHIKLGRRALSFAAAQE